MSVKTPDEVPDTKLPWPFFLIAIVLLLLSGVFLYFAVNKWIITLLALLGFAFACYGLVFRFCPPQPIYSKTLPLEETQESDGQPMSIRDLPLAFVGITFMASASPFLLMFWLLKYLRVRVQWSRQFPNSRKAEIRDFCCAIVSSFDCPLLTFYWFSPETKIIDIYRGFYGPRSSPENFEVEKFIRHMQKRYGSDLITSWQEHITVGELFSRAKPRLKSQI